MKEGRKKDNDMLATLPFPQIPIVWTHVGNGGSFPAFHHRVDVSITRDSFNFVNEMFRNLFPSGKTSFAISAANTVYESQGTEHVDMYFTCPYHPFKSQPEIRLKHLHQ
jgi:hypothetical protein